MPPAARHAPLVAFGFVAAFAAPAFAAGDRAAAAGVTVEVPAEPPGESLRRRVELVLPPHVGCAVLVVGPDAQGEAVDLRLGFGRLRLGDDSPGVTLLTRFRVGSKLIN